jgi:LPXTG-motif cell wall-anchored protein
MASSGVFSASTVSVIPEPSTFLIAGIGGLGLIGYGLRRRRVLGA